MLTAIIAAHESEMLLVPTLTALVPAATAGLLSEVIVADRASRDATAEVADFAGCRYISADAPAGERLKAAAATTRTPWLMFLRAGSVPEPGWIPAADRFMGMSTAGGTDRAAVFRPPGIADLMRPGLGELLSLVRVAFGGGPKPEQGLLIAKRFYLDIGGHPEGDDAEAALLRRIGRRRTVMLAASAHGRF